MRHAIALCLTLLATSATAQNISTPGIEGPDTPLLATEVCGVLVSLTERTKDGAVVVWAGPMLDGRVEALTPHETKYSVARIDLAQAIPALGVHCQSILMLRRRMQEIRKQQEMMPKA